MPPSRVRPTVMSPVMEYPEDLNPFGDDEEPKEETEPETPKIKTPGKSKSLFQPSRLSIHAPVCSSHLTIFL